MLSSILAGTTQTQTESSTILEREPNANLSQLLLFMTKKDPDFRTWIFDSASVTYTSPDNQNELLDIMGQSILRHIINNIHTSGHFTLMVDESPDNANKEQTVFCWRYIVWKFQVTYSYTC
jgi:hypothetical protein